MQCLLIVRTIKCRRNQLFQNKNTAVNQNDMSVIFTCQINSEGKSFVFMF